MISTADEASHRESPVRMTFLLSLILTVAASALTLSVAEGAFFPAGITIIAAPIAIILVDRFRLFRLPVLAANVLGVVAMAAAGNEFMQGNIEGKLLAGAHLIVYLQWVVLLMRKTHVRFWWTLTLSVLQIAVASVLTQNAGYGGALILLLCLLVWTISVFSLYRSGLDDDGVLTGSVQNSTGPSIVVHSRLQQDREELWIGWPFRAVVAATCTGSVAIGFVVFLVFPRIEVQGARIPGFDSDSGGLQSRTGFTEEVSLGDIGTILQSNDRVLQFSVKDLQDDQPLTPDEFLNRTQMDSLLFRGNSMGYYSDGTWGSGLRERGYRNGEISRRAFDITEFLPAKYEFRVTPDIPLDRFAFSPAPQSAVQSASERYRLTVRELSCSLLWARGRDDRDTTAPSYTVLIPDIKDGDPLKFASWTIPPALPAARQQELEQQISKTAFFHFITPDLETTLPRLYAQANQICADTVTDRKRSAETIVAYLMNPENFSYTLSPNIEDDRIDPVEDFLFNTRTGHCEYFASACTLMLQSVGIPARLVNGFKGSEVNSVSGGFEVRQRNAHSWVEAFYNGAWHTLDPTPAADEAAAVSQSSSLSFLNDMQLALNDFWNGGILNLTPEKQLAFFRPLKELYDGIRQSIRERGLMASIKAFFTEVVLSPDTWFSWKSWVTTFALLLPFGLLMRMNPLGVFRRFLDRIRRSLGSRQAAERSAVRFYEAFRQSCERHGLVLPAHQTALENARAAQLKFAGALEGETAEDLPLRIAGGFNQARFSATPLTTEQLSRMRDAVSEFARCLNQAPAASQSLFRQDT